MSFTIDRFGTSLDGKRLFVILSFVSAEERQRVEQKIQELLDSLYRGKTQ